MGSIETEPSPSHHGVFRFCIVDETPAADERALYAPAANKEVREEDLTLHDFRTDADIVRGPKGLDVQGFTYINHRSALFDSNPDPASWFADQLVEKVYVPEVLDLIKSVTGAKRAVVLNVATRRKLAVQQADKKFTYLRGCDVDQMLETMPRDVPMVVGKEVDSSLEPLRIAHIDCTMKGLRETARYCRKDIAAAAKEALDAEDEMQTSGANAEVPRYAAYTVWRPLKVVKRDPLAVLDWRSLDKHDLCAWDYRALSDVNADGEYKLEAYNVLPPADPSTHRWFWMPQQTPHEVLIAKFADTESEKRPDIAGGAPHASPIVPGTESEDARWSIEARVIVFW